MDPHLWKPDNLKFSKGGKDLISFNNYFVSANESEILYGANVQFGFEANAYTNVGFEDIYPNINLNAKHTENFLSIHNFCGLLECANKWDHYNVIWRTIDYGSVTHKHKYDGTVPITVGIQDILPPSGNLTLNGISFPVPQYSYDVAQVVISDVKDGEAGAYMDYFTDAAEVSEGKVSIELIGDDFNKDTGAIADALNKYNLGWAAGQIYVGPTLQSELIDTDPIGADYSTITFDENIPLIFDLPLTLRPKAYEYIQYNTIRRAGFDYQAWSGAIMKVYGPETGNPIKRVVAVHTNNYFIHWDFIVDVTFFATVPSTAELTTSILDNPYLKRGDWVWDSSITGAYDVKPILQKYNPIEEFFKWLGDVLFGDILSIIIIIIVIVVGIYIAIKTVPRLLFLRARKRSK